MKKLGVLGGMGPAASAEFMARLTDLTPARRDQDHIPTVLWSDPRVPDRTASIKNNDDLPLPWLQDGVRGLQAAGCDHIVIPCNTAHYWYNQLATMGTPITHIVDSVIEELNLLSDKKEKLGLLATQGTIESGLYQNKFRSLNWECILPTSEEMSRNVQLGIELVKANLLNTAHLHFLKVIQSLYNQGCKIIILGCTEIPLVVKEEHFQGIFLINSIDCLAKSVIKQFDKN